ncbi:MAG: hypothetical protein ACLTAS_00595 [Butyribacter sp.]
MQINLVLLINRVLKFPEIAPHFATTDAVRAAIGQDTHAYTPAQL